jgi:hypothetical protein
MKYLNIKGFSARLFLSAVIICSCFFYAAAQTVVKPAAVKPGAVKTAAAPAGASTLIDAFFKKYKDDGTGPAIDYLFGTNKLFDNNTGINVLKAKLDSLRQSIGKYLGKDLITQKNAGNSLVLYSYLVKHENSPVRFTFIFYKAQNDWVLYRFKYDDQMDIELEEGAKINNKHP